jgi:Ca-activated chloride channel family protein
MRLPKIVLLAAALPLAFLWSCNKAQAQNTQREETIDTIDPAPVWTEDDTPIPPMSGIVETEDPDLRPGTDPFPLKSLRVNTTITGTVAHVVVDQVFGNRNKKPIDAVYLFPLPHQAAIHDLSIRMGTKVICAKIQRKAEARRTYENAARQGKVAALLEQERPNLFQQSVANLMPGTELTVRTVMDMPVAFVGDETEFVFPTAVGPRFCPAGHVPDMGKIGAPRLPAGMVPPQKLVLNVVLDAGVPVTEIASPSHDMTVSGKGMWDTAVTLALRDGSTSPNKDFVLRWKARGHNPLASVVTDGEDKGGHFLLQIQPPALSERGQTAPKEIVFLVDQSGSMGGEPIAHLKKAMRKALREMDARDRFQIVGFSNVPVSFAPAPVLANPENVAKGLAFVETMDANGGTQMLDGIRQAFAYKPAKGALRVVCLMTDGLIGDEREIIQAVAREMGDATRVFTLGIGSSVNRWFLEEVAVMGKGQFQVATLDQDPAGAAAKFLDKIRRPVMTGIELSWNGVRIADQVPSRVPDLFDGEPLVVSGRLLSNEPGTLTVTGVCGGKRLRLEIPVDPSKGRRNSAIGSLWARARLAEMERTNQGSPTSDTIEAMTKLALRYRLASQYTSFVAVMDSVVNKTGKTTTVDVPLPLPEGVTEQALGGGADRMMAVSAGGATECRSVAWPASSPSAVMSSSVMDRVSDGLLGENVDPNAPNAIDVILAGGAGYIHKKGERGGRGGAADGNRMAAVGGEGLGTGGRAGFGVARGSMANANGVEVKGRIAPPKPADIELGGQPGSRSPESILRVIRQNIGGLQYSFRKALKSNPNLGGKITLKFTIAPSGDIVAIEIVSSDTGDDAFDTGIEDKARRMKFDSIERGDVTVTYAFVLDKN